MDKKEFVIKTYTQKELAGFYGVTPKTFRRWLKRALVDIGTRLGNYYSPQQVRIIVERLGYPFVWLAGVLLKSFIGVDAGDQQDEGRPGDDSSKLVKS